MSRCGGSRRRGVTVLAPLLCALLSAGLISVAGRPWGLEPLAWVAFVPAFIVLPRSRSWLQAGALAAVTALGVTTLAFEAAAALGAHWHLFAVLVGALPFAAAGAAAWAVSRHLPGWLGFVALALFWTAAEFVPAQSSLLGRYALPLSAIGYSQAGLPAMQLARFGSVTATSLALLLFNAAAARAWHAARSWTGATLRPRAGAGQPAVSVAARTAAPTAVPGSGSPAVPSAGSLAFPVATMALVTGLVGAAWLSAPAPTGPTFDVAIAQPNRLTAMLATAKAVDAVRDQVLAELTQLVDGAVLQNSAPRALASPFGGALRVSGPAYASTGAPDLVVFPEGSWPQSISLEAPAASLAPASVSALAALPPSLVGAAGVTSSGASTNSAFLWSGHDLTHAYAKLHLVPIAEAGLQAGAPPRPVAVPTSAGGVMQVAPFICYDVAFPQTVRRAVLAGAQLLAVLTDDAFAARGDVPHQHLRLARFRAVESGVPLAFSSNTGPSALIRADGSLAAVTAAGEATFVRAELGAGAGPTPYLRYGDRVGALTCLGAVLLTVLAVVTAAGKRGGVPSELTPAT